MKNNARNLDWLMSLPRAQFNSAAFAPGNGNWRASLTEEQRTEISRRASLAHKGKVLSDETRRKISEAHKGKSLPRTPEWQAKISAALRGRKGKPLSNEAKQKISAANKGRLLGRKLGAQSAEHKAKCIAARVSAGKTVKCVTPLGVFESRAAAARAYNVDPVSISNWVKQGKAGFYYADSLHQDEAQSAAQREANIRAERGSRKRDRGVITPLGNFPSIRSAAIAHCVDPSTLMGRLQRGWPGYVFLGGKSPSKSD